MTAALRHGAPLLNKTVVAHIGNVAPKITKCSKANVRAVRVVCVRRPHHRLNVISKDEWNKSEERKYIIKLVEYSVIL